MNTSLKSKRKYHLNPSEKEEEESVAGDNPVVKRIEFNDAVSPQVQDSRVSSLSHHDVITSLETITNVTESSKTINEEKQDDRNLNQNQSFDELWKRNSSTSSLENEHFVPAGQFFAENGDKFTSDYFSGTDTPSRLRASARRLTLRKPFNTYISYSSDEELGDWWAEPKTDYTYSASLSYRERVTPERSVGSPNMSRKGLRGGSSVGTVTSPPFSDVVMPSGSATSLSLRSRAVPRGGLGAFSDESDEEESRVIRSSRSNTKKWSESALLSRSNEGGVSSVTTTSKITYGLDGDEDTEEEVDSPVSQFAQPIVRRSTRRGLNATSMLHTLTTPPNSSYDAIDSNSASYYGNSINGRSSSSNTRVGNHVYTTSTTTTSQSSKLLNGGRKGYRLGEERHGYSYSEWRHYLWKNMSEYSRSSWRSVCTVSTIICASILLWTTSAFASTKSLFSQHRKQRSERLRDANHAKTMHRTVTTTTVMSRTQTVLTFSRTALRWYREKRRRSPCLWAWLPLLLLLMVMIPLLGYLFWGTSADGPIPSVVPSPSAWLALSSDKFNSFVSAIYSASSWCWSQLSAAVVYLGEMLIYFILYFFECVKNLVFFIFDFFRSAFVSAGNVLFYSSNSVYTLFMSSSTSSSNGEQASVSDLHWMKEYSPSTLFYNGYLVLEEGAKDCANWGGFLITKASAAAGSGVSAAWVGTVWLGGAIFQSLSLLASYVGLFLGLLGNCIASAFYGVINLFSRFFMLFPPLLANFSSKQTSSPPSPPVAVPPVTVSSSSSAQHVSSEDLVEQILRNPQLKNVITLSLEDSLIKNDISKESLSSVIKLNVEAEIGKIRSELLESKRTSDGALLASKQEINILKTQQEQLLNQLREMESSLKVMVTQQDNAEKSAVSKDELQNMLTKVSLNIEELSRHFKVLQTDHESLAVEVRSCCRNASSSSSLTLEQVEGHVTLLLTDLFGLSPEEGEDPSVLASRLRVWLKSYFVSKDELDGILSPLWQKLDELNSQRDAATSAAHEETVKQTSNMVMAVVLDQIRTEMKEQVQLETKEASNKFGEMLHTTEQNFQQYVQMRETKEETAAGGGVPVVGDVFLASPGLSASDVERIVRHALLTYDADKTGLVDHALESGGGSIISTRCTEGYEGHQAELTMFGYSFYSYSTNTPRSVIQPERNPGQCYAFKGSQGYVVIQFAGPVQMSSFTLEHIPRSLTPYGSIDSAPKVFSVYGLQTTEEEGVHLGDYTYDQNGEPLQSFPVQKWTEDAFNYVELKIHSNHGNLQYTCLYRFRVHGVRQF